MRYLIGQEIELKAAEWFYVYGLVDEDGVCFYIGVTSDPRRRLRQHWATNFNPRVYAKIRALKTPRMVILSDECTKTEALALEAQLIEETPNLFNQEQRPDYRQEHGRCPIIQSFLKTSQKVQ